MAVYQQDPYMQSSQIPPEDRSPGDYPPSSGLPPDALSMLAGMAPGVAASGPPMSTPGMSPGSAYPPPGPDQIGATAPGPRMAPGDTSGQFNQPGAQPGAQPGMGGPPPPGPQMAGAPMGDPMMAVRTQFDQVTSQLQMLAQAYPMAAEELMNAGEAIARAMLKIAQGVQPNPAMPPGTA